MSSTRILAVSLLLATAGRAAGQSSLGSERRDLSRLGGDVWAAWTSPAHIRGKDVPAVAGIATVIAATTLVDSAVYVWMTTHPNLLVTRLIGPVREPRLFSNAGNGQFLLPVSALMYVGGRLAGNATLRDAGLGCAAAHLSSAGLREVAYLSVSRLRPHETPSPHVVSLPGRKDWNYHSFLSGHIANSMSCASFFAHRFDVGLAAPVLYAYPITIGLGRMADGWHWASDTMTGAVVGVAIGKLIADRQRTRTRSATESVAARSRSYRIGWSVAF